MKKLIAFLLLINIPNICFGDKYDDVKQDSVFEYLQEYNKAIQKQLPIIKERMKQIDPEFAESVKNDTEEQQILKYNNYLAEKTFNDYKDFFMWKMEQKSIETGREIKQRNVGFISNYWLDRGILDSEQCKDQQKHINICFYPDGFEDFSISIKHKHIESDSHELSSRSLFVSEDNIKTNTHNTYTIKLSSTTRSNKSDRVSGRIFLTVTKLTNDYQEYHQYRNQEQQDIKDGMIQYTQNKQTCNSFEECDFSEITDDYKKWKSLQGPMTKIKSQTSNYRLSYKKESSNE